MPFSQNAAYLLIRGMKTLHLRVQQQNSTGMGMAKILEAHPKVRWHWHALPCSLFMSLLYSDHFVSWNFLYCGMSLCTISVQFPPIIYKKWNLWLTCFFYSTPYLCRWCVFLKLVFPPCWHSFRSMVELCVKSISLRDGWRRLNCAMWEDATFFLNFLCCDAVIRILVLLLSCLLMISNLVLLFL